CARRPWSADALDFW
nr:immunoglobulin heavy chain junction region [Macaca mulatta]